MVAHTITMQLQVGIHVDLSKNNIFPLGTLLDNVYQYIPDGRIVLFACANWLIWKLLAGTIHFWAAERIYKMASQEFHFQPFLGIMTEIN